MSDASCVSLSYGTLEVGCHFQAQADWWYPRASGWLAFDREQIICLSRPLQFDTVNNNELLIGFQVANKAP